MCIRQNRERALTTIRLPSKILHIALREPEKKVYVLEAIFVVLHVLHAACSSI